MCFNDSEPICLLPPCAQPRNFNMDLLVGQKNTCLYIHNPILFDPLFPNPSLLLYFGFV